MQDVIGMRAYTKTGRTFGFMTWGRLWGATDESPYQDALMRHIGKFEIPDVARIEICESLHEVSSCKYFYEAYLHFTWHSIPFGDGYERWRTSVRFELDAVGNGFYFLGEIQ